MLEHGGKGLCVEPSNEKKKAEKTQGLKYPLSQKTLTHKYGIVAQFETKEKLVLWPI